MELPTEDRRIAEELNQDTDKVQRTLHNIHSIRNFTEVDIEKITSNYTTPIGKGGFGEVYRGVLHDDGDYDLVAVKRYIRAELKEEFMEEVSIHSQINHTNVVKLIGYCAGEKNLTMITEYIPKGNLDDALHNRATCIPLDIRMGIAIGCAEALSYMHSMHLLSDSLVCHGDIKPANILLDENFTAKLSDFGLSRLLSGGITRYTSNVKGSIDYMDPIYLREGRLSPRSDVYSFGAVLLELIARRRVKQGNISLIGTLFKAFAKGKGLMEIFDAEIANERNVRILEEMARLATECLGLDIDKRPHINDVVERLLMLWKGLRGGHDISWRKKSFGMFKRNASNSEILMKFGNVRILTKEELSHVTQNYSYRLTCPVDVYKGRLEDNTVVIVKKFCGPLEDLKEHFNNASTMCQIAHKNIIEVLGLCLESEMPIVVYKYCSKGNLSSVLESQEDFPLDLRVKIAVQIAEALEYLHSSATGIIGHGCVVPSAILLDGSYVPKLSLFSVTMRLMKENEATSCESVISSSLLGNVLYNDPIRYEQVLLTVKRDVFDFGIVLLALISRKYFTSVQDRDYFILQFMTAYISDNSGKAIFDKDVAAEKDIIALEEIGRLALDCIHVEIHEKPTMKEVAARLQMIRRSWKNHIAKDTQVTGTEAAAVIINNAEGIKPDDGQLGAEIKDTDFK